MTEAGIAACLNSQVAAIANYRITESCVFQEQVALPMMTLHRLLLGDKPVL